MLTAKPDFWKSYYEDVASEGKPWLDCSNERTHLQTISFALEAAGRVIGRRCLELGCGRGHLSRCLEVLEAEDLVAADQVDSMLAGFAEQHPSVDWRTCDASDSEALRRLGRFDLVFAVEMLQYVPIAPTLECLVEMLEPGGRMVGIVPNAACPLVQAAMERFDGAYVGAEVNEIKSTLNSNPSVDWWTCRGLSFAEDQRVAPYEASPWTNSPSWTAPPNRIVFVAETHAG